jgi:PAS domain S-box-containing protein
LGDNPFEDLQDLIHIDSALAYKILDSIPACISITTDLSCKEIRHNNGAAEFLRIQSWGSHSFSSSLKHPVKVFSDGKELIPDEMPMQRAAWKGEEVRAQEIEFLWEDGVRKYARVNANPIYDNDGKITGAVAVFEDISGLKRAEEILSKSEERYRSLFNSMGEGFYVIERVEGRKGEPVDFRYVEANPAFVAQAGLGAVVGKTIRQVVPEAGEWVKIYLKVLQTGQAIRFERELTSMNRVLELYAFPVDNKTNSHVAVISQDITERKQAEQALLRSEHELVAELEAAEHIQDLNKILAQAYKVEVFYEKILDTAKAVLHSDFATLFIFHPERGIKGELYLLAHRGFTDREARLWEWMPSDSQSISATALKTRKRVTVPDLKASASVVSSDNLEILDKIGIRAAQATPIISRNGTLLGVFSTHWREPHELTAIEIRILDVLVRQAADLIERAQVEAALRESEEQYRALAEQLQEIDQHKDEFLGILSHEIRNPLASIMLCLSLLDKVGSDGEQAVKFREIMGRQAAQLARLVDDLLDVTRITRGKIVLQKESIDLGALVCRTVEDFQAAFQEKGITLDVQLPPVELYAEADPARLSQVVGNLLQNSLKFTEPGGYTRVSVMKDDPKHDAVICVEDNGIGMTPEELKYLFKPFMQADSSLDRKGTSGLGLGLVLVKGLTEMHCGAVSACSDGPGKGSAFMVSLPLSTGPLPVQLQKASSDIPFCSRRVLVIEDIRDVAEALRSLLVGEGHEVMVAYDGVEGLAMAKEFHPDILLCDIGLPSMDGYQIARAFCADEGLKDVYLISLTGYVLPKDIKKAKDAGFHDQLAKPVKPEQIKEALAKVPDRMPKMLIGNPTDLEARHKG